MANNNCVLPVTAHSTDVSSEEMSIPSSSDMSKDLSVSYDVLQISGCRIHEDTLKGTWQKASSLVADTTLIVPVPGGPSSSYNRMVASTSGDCPHLVTAAGKFTGQFKCDSKCPMFNTYKLCAHTIATAEVTGKLTEFTQWLAKQKCAPNYNKLALRGLPKGAGQKGGIQKQKRRRKTEVAKKTVVDRLAVNNQSSVCSRKDQHVEGGLCFTPAATMENEQNTWMSPSCSYHVPTYVQPNMMHCLPP